MLILTAIAFLLIIIATLHEVWKICDAAEEEREELAAEEKRNIVLEHRGV